MSASVSSPRRPIRRRDTLSASEARRLALAAQGFGQGRPAAVTTRQLNAAMKRMSVLQIDSVNVFARSHYLPLFSRLGPYETAELDRLLFSRRPRYVEYWAHVASFVAAADRPLFAFRMAELRAKSASEGGWYTAHRDTVAWVRAELAARGPLRPAEIERDARSGPRGPWWDWDVVKDALEHLWLFGEVAIAGRRGFERVYGLAADVLGPELAAREVPRDDAIRELVRRAAIAYGVATAADLADYWRIRDRPAVLSAVRDLVDMGELEPVSVAGWSVAGRQAPAWRHRDVRAPRRVEATALLTPFDPVVWFRDRAERLFDFSYRIEIYTPPERRRFGYYSLPVLVDDTIAGRIDLKADRASSTLLVQSAWWEGAPPPDAADRVAAELRAAADWQQLETISVSRWGDATDALAGALGITARHDAGPSASEPSDPSEAPLLDPLGGAG